jgi:hypothetical protein
MRDRVHLLLIAGLLALSVALANAVHAGIRGPGKYCGVVIFDRWDSCILYSSIYVMYVSEKVKEQLRPYAGQAIEIDAQEVSQPINPGDGLISKLKYLSPAPKANRSFEIEGLHLRAVPSSADGEPPVLDAYVKNGGDKARTVAGSELAPTLLAQGSMAFQWFKPFDGPSFALITRWAFAYSSEEPRTEYRSEANGRPFGYRSEVVPARFELKQGEERRVRIRFDLPAGEY